MGLLIASLLASVLVSFNYTRGLVQMFTFIIKLSTLSCLLPYLFSSLSEIMLYLRKKKAFHKLRFMTAVLISIPAFLYSAWAVSGLGGETLLWGSVLLAAGLPIFVFLKLKDRRKSQASP
jgi:APA family basic amino acid/polyamine antiporter